MQPVEKGFLADTHCHLDFNVYDTDRELVLSRARQAGLKRILNPGIDLPSSAAAVRLAGSDSDVFAAVGIHPNESLSFQPGMISDLRELASGEKVVAIGEIGLDYYREWAPHDKQRQAFLAQLELAAEFELPVIIHNRQASDDLINILTDWQVGLRSSGSKLAECPGTLHSFSGVLETALKVIDHHFMIGITGPITFRNARDLQQVVVELPIESLLTETDAPFLTPHPHRGQRNEPAYVRLVAEQIASLKQIPYADFAQQAWENAGRLFQWV
jgi:TatD DNase family protein